MAVREYRLHLSSSAFLDQAVEAFRQDADMDEIEGQEVGDDLAARRGAVRRFILHPYTLDRMSGVLTISAQDSLSGEWVTVVVGEDVRLQVVDM